MMHLGKEEELKYLSVRLEDSIGDKSIGSGVIWKPNDNSKYGYVYTAAHVVRNKSDIRIRYKISDREEDIIDVDDEDIAVHEKYNKESDFNYDIAVIRFKNKKSILGHIKPYKISKLDYINGKKELIFRGFPESIETKSFHISNKLINAKYENKDDDLKYFTYSLSPDIDVNSADRDEELVGLSGSGIFLTDSEDLELIGIHTNGIGSGAALSMLGGVLADRIVEICDDKEWDSPMFAHEIHNGLDDAIENFYSEIEDEKLIEIMENLVDKTFIDKVSISFCGSSKECKFISNPNRCQTYINHVLIVSCILKYINERIDFDDPHINKNEIPVKYICCDGICNRSRVQMKHFIRSIKFDYLNRVNVKNNSIVFWGSEKEVKHEKVFTSKEFKNILPSIMDEMRFQGFDIAKGRMHPKNLSIVNVSAAVDIIEKEGLSGIIELINSII